MKKIIAFFIIIFIFYNLNSQNTKSDSLRNIINSTKIDTIKINAMNLLVQEIYRKTPDAAFDTINLSITIAEKIKYNEGLAMAFKWKAIIFFTKSLTDSAQLYFDKSLQIYNKLNDKLNQAKIYNNIGLMYKTKNDYPKAIIYYEKSLEFFKQTEDKQPVIVVCNNLGTIYYLQGDYQRALTVCFDGLKIFDEIKQKVQLDSLRTGYLYITIANIYTIQKKYLEAEKNYNNALIIFKSCNSESDVADTYINFGNLYGDQNSIDYYIIPFWHLLKFTYSNEILNNAELFYYKKALNLYSKADKIALANYNVASSYISLQKYDSAKVYLDEAYRMYQQLEDNRGIALANYLYGNYFDYFEDYKNSAKYMELALITAKEIGDVKLIERISYSYYVILKELKQFDKSLEILEIYTQAHENIFNSNNEKKLTEVSMTYEFEKEKQETEIKFQEQIRRQRLVRNFSLLILLVSLGALFAVFTALRIKKRKNEELQRKNAEILQAKEEIEAQRDEIEDKKQQIEIQAKEIEIQRDLAINRGNELEQKNQDIEASIHYALRIQRAILPSIEPLKAFFEDYFIYYKPRDIVSGDFYWISQRNNRMYVVAADCTGHGVPGAFMSLLGVTFLNQILVEFPEIQANDVLHRLRDMIIYSLKQDAANFDSTRDGMDMSLIIYDKDNSEIQFSGAYNSIYIVTENTIEIENKEYIREFDEKIDKNKLYEIRADRMPIGVFIKENIRFEKHSFKINKNDKIFLFSDGYPDMYNRNENQKFTAKRFKKLILETSDDSMTAQMEKIDSKFNEWVGNHKQIDDILVIGVKI